jgi:hypothetical protein
MVSQVVEVWLVKLVECHFLFEMGGVDLVDVNATPYLLDSFLGGSVGVVRILVI